MSTSVFLALAVVSFAAILVSAVVIIGNAESRREAYVSIVIYSPHPTLYVNCYVYVDGDLAAEGIINPGHAGTYQHTHHWRGDSTTLVLVSATVLAHDYDHTASEHLIVVDGGTYHMDLTF